MRLCNVKQTNLNSNLAQMVLFSDLARPGLGNVLDSVKAASILKSSHPILARLAAKRKRMNAAFSGMPLILYGDCSKYFWERSSMAPALFTLPPDART